MDIFKIVTFEQDILSTPKIFYDCGLFNLIIHIARDFNEIGFNYIHTPIITSSDAEGAGEMFQVTTLDNTKIDNYGNIIADSTQDAIMMYEDNDTIINNYAGGLISANGSGAISTKTSDARLATAAQ